jgi:hypothetical protein
VDGGTSYKSGDRPYRVVGKGEWDGGGNLAEEVGEDLGEQENSISLFD